MTENNFIWFGGAGRDPVSELLELLLGARSLGDLEYIEAHGLAQGPALAHCDDVADLDISVDRGSGDVILGVGGTRGCPKQPLGGSLLLCHQAEAPTKLQGPAAAAPLSWSASSVQGARLSTGHRMP